MINFITNLPRDLRSGGFSAMNAVAVDTLEKVFELSYVGPINPGFIFSEKAISKAKRVVGLRGTFSFFSEQRLDEIAALVDSACRAEATVDYFHGFTPWIHCRAPRPYIASSDCTFRDYFRIYHRRDRFDEADIERIEKAEAQWLRGAERVLFSNNWAARRAISDYGLDPGRVTVVGSFGAIDLPRVDRYDGAKTFIFVSTDFRAKGGDCVMLAFDRVRQRHPDATLTIVGDPPPISVPPPGVSIAGYLRKEVRSEHDRFESTLALARAIVHPTHSDVAPLILVEAAYFGCPAVSSRYFAIPELVEDGETGLLVDDPFNAEALSVSMLRILEDDDAYREMRRKAWAKSRVLHSKERFEKELQRIVSDVCGSA